MTLSEELLHKSSAISNENTVPDPELINFEKVGTVLICDQAATSPNGITSGINKRYFDGQLIRTPTASAPEGSNKALLADLEEDVQGDKGSVLYVTNVRGRVVGNNPHRELITKWTENNDKYSVLNNQTYPENNDLQDCTIDFKIVPIIVGLQVGGENASKLDPEDGMGFIKVYKQGSAESENEVCLTLKNDILEEKVKWYLPRKGPVNRHQVLGLENVQGSEALLKWVDIPVLPIDPDPTDNCIPNWVEIDLLTNVCVTKTGYSVSDVTVEKRKFKLLNCGPIGPAKCVTSPTSDNCCPPIDEEDLECLSFSICSNFSYPSQLCASLETQFGTESVELIYGPEAMPDGLMADYIGTATNGKKLGLYLGGEQNQLSTSNITPLGALLYYNGVSIPYENDNSAGCNPLFLKFSNQEVTVSVTECQGVIIDCPELVDPGEDDPECMGYNQSCSACTKSPNNYFLSLSGLPEDYNYLNGSVTLLSQGESVTRYGQSFPYPPTNNVSSLLGGSCQWYPLKDGKGAYGSTAGVTLLFSSQVTSYNPFTEAYYLYVVLYSYSTIIGGAVGAILKDRYVVYRKLVEFGTSCCKNYTLDFYQRMTYNYNIPGVEQISTERGPFPATIEVISGDCCDGEGGNPGCSNRPCNTCPGKTPKRFVVTISGLSACSSMNGTYNYDQSADNPCKFVRTGARVGSAYDEITLSGATATLTISNSINDYVIFSGSYTTCTALNLTFTGGGGSCGSDTNGTAIATSNCTEDGGGGGGGGSVSTPCCAPNLLPTTLVATFTGTYATFGSVNLTWDGTKWQFVGTISSVGCGTITQMELTCNYPGPPTWLLGITALDIDGVTPIGGALGSTFEDCTVPQIEFDSIATAGACAGAFSVIISE